MELNIILASINRIKETLLDIRIFISAESIRKKRKTPTKITKVVKTALIISEPCEKITVNNINDAQETNNGIIQNISIKVTLLIRKEKFKIDMISGKKIESIIFEKKIFSKLNWLL